MSFTMKGDKKVARAIRSIGAAMPPQVRGALYAEAQIERGESMKRTPVKFGTLMGSHDVEDPVTKGKMTTVIISVGGPTRASPEGAGYAVYVHEDQEASHPNGQAKFLESTIHESAPFMPQRIAARINIRKGA